MLSKLVCYADSKGVKMLIHGDWNLTVDQVPLSSFLCEGELEVHDTFQEIATPTRMKWENNDAHGRHIDFSASHGMFVVHDRFIVLVKRFDGHGNPTPMRSDHMCVAYDIETPLDSVVFKLPRRTHFGAHNVTQPMWEDNWSQSRVTFLDAVQGHNSQAAWRVLSGAFESALCERKRSGAERSQPATVVKQTNNTSHAKLGRLPQIFAMRGRIVQWYKQPHNVGLGAKIVRNQMRLGQRDGCHSLEQIAFVDQDYDLAIVDDVIDTIMRIHDETKLATWQHHMQSEEYARRWVTREDDVQHYDVSRVVKGELPEVDPVAKLANETQLFGDLFVQGDVPDADCLVKQLVSLGWTRRQTQVLKRLKGIDLWRRAQKKRRQQLPWMGGQLTTWPGYRSKRSTSLHILSMRSSLTI